MGKVLTDAQREELRKEAENRITRERVQLLCDPTQSPFFAFLAMNLILRYEPECQTMSTDGVYLYYNPEYVATTTNEELRGLVAHEALHPALGHLWRGGPREHERWNYACDYVVNLILKHNGFTIKKGLLLDEQYDNMCSEEVYSKLNKGDGGGGGGKGGGKGPIGGGGSHDYWDRAGQKEADAPENGEGIWQERVARAAAAAKMQGRLPSDLESLIGDVLSPKLPWREILCNFVQDTQKTNYRMNPPSKRYLHIPLIMASLKGEMLEAGLVRDTSGSMSDDQLKVVTSEMLGIADMFENFKLHVWDNDARVQKYTCAETFDEVEDAVVTAKGRGGTDFRPVFEDIEEKGLEISCLVFMTDTLGTFPDEPPSYPVLWIVDQPDRKVPFGEMLFLDMNE